TEARAIAANDGRRMRVDGLLQRFVERSNSACALVHRREHLDVAHRVEAELGRQAVRDQIPDDIRAGLRDGGRHGILVLDRQGVAQACRVLLRHEEEIVTVHALLGVLPMVDGVRVSDDQAALGLPENLVQDHDRDPAAA
ncbi:hypothetical protein DIZ68_15635, partial [Legionella pneumophila]